MTKDDILQEMRDAFADTPRPSRTMADAEVEDDQDEASRFEECDDRWWEIPDMLLDRCSAPFFCLSEKDFLYYLPAYMSRVVRLDGKSKYVSPEFLIYYLEDSKRSARIAALMSTRQISTVHHFLEWVVSNQKLIWIRDHATAALCGWGKRVRNPEPCAAPSGGPATQLGNSGVTEGSPSVS